jgi:hypothetical protein
VDLVVLLLIAVVLLGLFFPFAQRLRGADQRSRCQENLKVLCLAVHNYAGTYTGNLPSLYSAPRVVLTDATKPATAVGLSQSLFFSLLPYLGQNEMYMAGFKNAATPGLRWTGRLAKGQIYGAGSVKAYVCPADPTNSTTKPTDLSWVGGSYGANFQVFGNPRVPEDAPPEQQFRSVFTINNIPDGTSNTVFFADRFAQYPGAPARFKDPDGKEQQAHSLWAWPAGHGTSPPSRYKKPVPQNAAMFAYGDPVQKDIGYGKVVFDQPQPEVTPKQADYRLVQSGHAKVIQVGMGDGSSRAVSALVSQPTWQHVLTPADGTPVGADW